MFLYVLITFGTLLILDNLAIVGVLLNPLASKTVIAPVKESIYDFVKSVSSLALIATTVALIKALVYWKKTTKKDFKALFLESAISIIAGSLFGILFTRYLNETSGVIAAAVVSNLGSRITTIIDQLTNIGMKGVETKVNNLAGKKEESEEKGEETEEEL